MITSIESPGPIKDFPGSIDEYNRALDRFRLVQTGAIPSLAELTIIEVPNQLEIPALQRIQKGE